MTVAQRIFQLRHEIQLHDYYYYVEDSPKISDATYDALMEELKRLESVNPELITDDSPTQRVSGRVVSSFVEVDHLAPMLSLETVMGVKDVVEFFKRTERELEHSEIEYVVEPKFDGLSVEIVYQDGLLERGSTRGDGYAGEDITDNLKTIRSVPLNLITAKRSAPKTLAVRAEVIMRRQKFQELNKRMIERGKAPFANPRNAAAGSLRQLDSSVTANRVLDLFAYEIMFVEGTTTESQKVSLEALSQWGFRVDESFRLCRALEEVVEYHAVIEKKRQELEYDLDGVVVKVNHHDYQRELGYRSRTPRFAVAFKFKPEQEITKVIDIILQVGRTGKLTPVALLQPVDVSGVTVSRATLHNRDEVLRKDVRVGDRVRIQRAGDVIPEVVEVLSGSRNSESAIFQMPTHCPVSGSIVIERGANHYCSGGWSCLAQKAARLEHFVSKGAVEVEFLGEKTVAQLVESGLVKDFADLYTLTVTDLLKLEGFAEKSANNLIVAIESSKRVRLDRFIYALGIPNVGKHVARVLAAHFGNLSRFIQSSEDVLVQIHEIGEEVARNVVEFFRDDGNLRVIERIQDAGVLLDWESTNVATTLLGSKIVFSGTLGLSRDEAKRLVEQCGGRVVSSVSKNTSFVVVGGNPGAKAEKAKELGVKLCSETDFLEIVGY